MRKDFNIVDNDIFVLKNCQVCIHFSMCKFHEKMKEVCNSNVMYQMQEYDLHNNCLDVFERHASCQYYKHDVKELTHDMKYKISKLHIPQNFVVHSTQFNGNIVKFNGKYNNSDTTTNVDIDLTDVFNMYKII